ncbi:MAG: hypothetical protein AAF383_07150 [Cyanobacteria bacterium P01_A01_bin.83]
MAHNLQYNLKDGIEELYRAFADVPKPHFVDGCSCCIGRKEISVLLSKPVRKISAGELASYAASVFLTVGNETDFQYFLPRIFELSVTEKGWYPCPEVVLGKLKFVQWQEWSKLKTTAIESFLELAFVNFVLQPEKNPDSLFFGDEPDTWLCAIAISGAKIETLLKRIQTNGKALVTLYELNSETLIKGKLFNGFWHDLPDSQRIILKWFQSEEIMQLINQQYLNQYDDQN